MRIETNETNEPISLPNVVFVYLYSEFFIGALSLNLKKRNGEGPCGGWVGSGIASGLSASSRRRHESVNLNGHLITGLNCIE
jgi:hypothetical protein